MQSVSYLGLICVDCQQIVICLSTNRLFVGNHLFVKIVSLDLIANPMCANPSWGLLSFFAFARGWVTAVAPQGGDCQYKYMYCDEGDTTSVERARGARTSAEVRAPRTSGHHRKCVRYALPVYVTEVSACGTHFRFIFDDFY